MVFGNMYFRMYNPAKDCVICNYTEEDWSFIFKGVDEDELKKLSVCTNVIILLWCDVDTDNPHGMIYLVESHIHPCEVSFHGGTWNHDSKFYFRLYYSLSNLMSFLLKIGAQIKTTCAIDNTKAKKILRSLGFEETHRDSELIYKALDLKKFEQSSIVRRMQ